MEDWAPGRHGNLKVGTYRKGRVQTVRCREGAPGRSKGSGSGNAHSILEAHRRLILQMQADLYGDVSLLETYFLLRSAHGQP